MTICFVAVLLVRLSFVTGPFLVIVPWLFVSPFLWVLFLFWFLPNFYCSISLARVYRRSLYFCDCAKVCRCLGWGVSDYY